MRGWGRGSQCNDKPSGATPSSEFLLPLTDLLLVSPSDAAHEAREAFLLRRQPSDLMSQLEAICDVLFI